MKSNYNITEKQNIKTNSEISINNIEDDIN